MNVQGYDLVGDIHGHADALHRLLGKLDYAEVEGVFRHPERQMIFVGDFIDRGPQQREVLRIARSMCEAGLARAVMGNHEFNAIGWGSSEQQWEIPAEPFGKKWEPARKISSSNRRGLRRPQGRRELV
jgi:calcineurin-like phosphoesterase family protein